MAANQDTTRILIVEDHPVFIFGLKELLHQETDLVVCGQAESVGEAWEKIESLSPDLVIVDITLKGRNGIELIRDIKKHYKDLPVLVLSMHAESLFAERALSAGARGYIVKEEASDNIVAAIRCVLNGEVYASHNLMKTILNRIVTQSDTDKSPLKALADRELEVFYAIGIGMSSRQIASKLHLSIKTIGTYRERIKEKLGLANANALIRYAVRWVEHHPDLNVTFMGEGTAE
ncbi:MAG: response regulator transcription factor [Desulfosarcinaceae bacterium]|nr:response regulator transcription factor [Desulfosarcinaceae bacterium]